MPNIILPFFGGINIDKIGIRSTLLIFSSFLIIGQGLCVLGALNKDFTLLQFGMFFLVVNDEVNLLVTQSTLLTKWFLGKEISLAFWSIYIALNSLPYIILFYNLKTYQQAEKYQQELTVYVKYVENFVACMIYCMVIIFITTLCCIIQIIIDYISDKNDTMSWNDLKEFNYVFYLISFSFIFGYFIFLILQLNALPMFQTRYNLTFALQTLSYSLPYFICIIDNECLNYVSLLPYIPTCVSQNAKGTRFGVVCSLQNADLTIFLIIVGTILSNEKPKSYQQMIYFLGYIAILANISNINIYFYDISYDNKLLTPTIKLSEYEIVEENEDK